MNFNIIFILAANVLLINLQVTEAAILRGFEEGSDRSISAPLRPQQNGKKSVVAVTQYLSEQDCKDGRNPTGKFELPAPKHYEPVGCLALPTVDQSISIGCLAGTEGSPQVWEYRGATCDAKALEGTNDIGNGECLWFSKPDVHGSQNGIWLALNFRESSVCPNRPENVLNMQNSSTKRPKLASVNESEENEEESTMGIGAFGYDQDSNLLGGFSCAGGTIKRYSFYEAIAQTGGGTRCIGGSGGDPFWMHSYRTTVKTLRVWWGHGSPNDGFRAIQVEYFNGKTSYRGKIPSTGADASFTFKAGEMLDGSIVIGGNGVGSRTGYLHFKTNRDRSFTAGKLHTPYYFQASGTLLAGFFGASGYDIDHLGVYLFKEVSKIEISGINYPTLDSYLSGLTPSSIVDRPYCNNTPIDQKEVRTVTISSGSKEEWGLSATTSFEMTVSISVSAGVPEIFSASTSTSYKWGISITGSYKMTQDNQEKVEQEFTFMYPAYSKGRYVVTQFDSTINVPWEGSEKVTFKDGKSITIDVNGEYDGVYVSSITPIYDSTPCDPCICSDEDVVFNS